MESACLYLEGGTHSYQLVPSHLVPLEETEIEFQVSAARGRGCGLIYLLREITFLCTFCSDTMQVSLFHQNHTVYAAFFKTPPWRKIYEDYES